MYCGSLIRELEGLAQDTFLIRSVQRIEDPHIGIKMLLVGTNIYLRRIQAR